MYKHIIMLRENVIQFQLHSPWKLQFSFIEALGLWSVVLKA